MLTVAVLVRPWLLVAVSWMSRCEGYSWSGAGKLPPATPGNVSYVCVWQLEGQCWMSTTHESWLAASVPSSGSVAWPVNVMGTPTFHVKVDGGVSMTAVGAATPAVIVIGALMAD